MTESIKDRVAIIGMGCTKFGENWYKNGADMVIDAAYEAYADAGIEPRDLQAAWVGTAVSGMTGQAIAIPLQLDYLPVTRVENACATGTDAFRNACYAVAAGIYDIVLALGFEKLKDSGYSGLPGFNIAGDSTWTRPQAEAPAMFGLLATRYFARYGLAPEEGKRMLARISVKSHYNGARCPKAHFQREVTLEQVMSAPIIAWPLGLFDCCGVSDGAAAAIITRGDQARTFRDDPVYVKALTITSGPWEVLKGNRYDYTHVEENVRSAQKAYAEAGIKNPRQEISMAEVHDCFSITEAVTMEDLGFSPRGKVKEDIESGFFDLKGGLPVQPDGGLKCFGHPIGASGLRMLYEMYKQLQGKAQLPERQIKNPKLGLTHNLGGNPTSCNIGMTIVGL